MARFEEAVKVVLAREGGFSDHPQDPGGPTKYGVSLRFLKGLGDFDRDGFLDGDVNRDGKVDVADVRDLTHEQAIGIYRRIWITPYTLMGDQRLATEIFDTAVHAGTPAAHRIVQRALRACGQYVAEDGILGALTMTAIGRTNPTVLLAAFKSERAGFYRILAAQRRDLRWALNGWLRRAYSTEVT